ncbi:unnamed protein product [marine sediment metagenome]|uniref:Uncharacterized protein n=1 Tax=marine sediment metagenome TaxID=412755 RepID=X1EP21_9ZZZZ
MVGGETLYSKEIAGAPGRTLFEFFSKTWNKKIENVEIPSYPIPVSLAMEDACP